MSRPWAAPGASRDRVESIVRFFQSEPWADVIFTGGGSGGLGGVSGTFSLDLIGNSHPDRAPDIVVTLPWVDAPNASGVAGAPKLGQKIHDLGDKLEKDHTNPDHPHKA